MKNSKVFILWLLLTQFCVYGQDFKPRLCNNQFDEMFKPKLVGEIYNPNKIGLGTQFFNDNWAVGDILLRNGECVPNEKIKYNGLLDELIWLSKSYEMVRLEKYFITEFCFRNYKDNSSIRFKKISINSEKDKDSSEIFAQVMYENKLSLFVYRKITASEKILVSKGENSYEQDVYKPTPIYYLLLPDNKILRFTRFKKRDLLKLFPDKKDQMRKLFKEKYNHGYSTEEDLVRITEILNTLFEN